MLSVPECAESLGIPPDRLYRMVQEGVVPAVRTYGRYRIGVDPEAVRLALSEPRPLHPTDVPVYQKMFTPAEAAALIGCSVRTVRRMCTDGTLKATRNPGPNSHLRIHADSLLEYLEQGVVA